MIRGYAKTAAPLNRLLQKGAKFEFNGDCVDAFESFKAVLASNEVLAMPDFSRQFWIACDASYTAIGASLSQIGHAGIERPVSFYGRSFTGAEKGWSATEIEGLSLLESVW